MAMTAAEPSHREQASTPASQAFEQLAEPFRRELKLHCYRMLGSVHEAEDLAQETYLRAWRNFDSFEGRGSFRAWLYRIATNACLDALASRKNVHRLLPDQRAPAAVQMPDGAAATDVAWLEPYPDADLEGIADDAPNPAARYASAGRGQALDRHDRGAVGLRGEHRAGLDRLAVEIDGACAAMARLAPDVRTGKAEVVADEMDQQRIIECGRNHALLPAAGDANFRIGRARRFCRLFPRQKVAPARR
jgi:RNA polymerase sigma factor (sigma-70 family)